MRQTRTLFWGLALVLLLGAVGVVVPRLWQAPQPTYGVLLQSPQPLENFALTNTHGERMQLAELRGKYLLLFFGYTYCPDVCPTTLADLSRAVQALGAKAEQVQVIMVSVDPERDTPQRLGAHLAAFDPSFIGLTGTPEQVSALATAFGIFYEKHEGSPATSYLVDHTASVTLVDPEGYVRMLFPFNTSGQGIAADLLPLLH